VDDATLWAAVSAIASGFSSLFAAGSIVFVLRQLRETQKATYAQTFYVATARLQDEKTREDRKVVFQLKNKPVAQWTTDEIAAAERVCQTYDTIAVMVRNGMLPKNIILEHWGNSMSKIWFIVSPLILQYRSERNFPGHWDDFEWLALQVPTVLKIE
jgi:hypothetical protein